MAITKRNPNTVHLGGPIVHIDDETFKASASITPGMWCEFHDVSGEIKVRPHATDSEQVPKLIALERLAQQSGDDAWDKAYASGDVVRLAFAQTGSKFWSLVRSGEDVANAEYMQSNGDGALKTASATTASANVAKFQALEAVAAGGTTAFNRVRVHVIQ